MTPAAFAHSERLDYRAIHLAMSCPRADPSQVGGASCRKQIQRQSRPMPPRAERGVHTNNGTRSFTFRPFCICFTSHNVSSLLADNGLLLEALVGQHHRHVSCGVPMLPAAVETASRVGVGGGAKSKYAEVHGRKGALCLMVCSKAGVFGMHSSTSPRPPGRSGKPMTKPKPWSLLLLQYSSTKANGTDTVRSGAGGKGGRKEGMCGNGLAYVFTYSRTGAFASADEFSCASSPPPHDPSDTTHTRFDIFWGAFSQVCTSVDVQ